MDKRLRVTASPESVLKVATSMVGSAPSNLTEEDCLRIIYNSNIAWDALLEYMAKIPVTLKELIIKVGFDYANENITDENFPRRPSAKGAYTLRSLLCPKKDGWTSDEAVEYIEGLGRTPADSYDLVKYVLKRGKDTIRYPIIAHGSVCSRLENNGEELLYVAMVCRNKEGKLMFRIDQRNMLWRPYCRVLTRCY